MNAPPSIVSFFSIACGISVLTLASLVQAPLPQDNLQAFQDCSKLHPARYCRITYLPSTIEAVAKE
jgi:hypothetical protein